MARNFLNEEPAYSFVTVLTNAFLCCVSIETKSAFAGETSLSISADGIFSAVVSTILTLVNVDTRLPIPSETFSTSTHVRPVGVNTLYTIVSEAAVILVVGAFINVLTGESISYITFLGATIIAFLCVNTSGPLVALMNTKLTFISKLTVFDSISMIAHFALAFVSTWKVHAFGECWMTYTTLLQKKKTSKRFTVTISILKERVWKVDEPRAMLIMNKYSVRKFMLEILDYLF